MSILFSKPRIPVPPMAPPPAPVRPQDSALNAQLAQLGRRQGLVAAMFGYKQPAGPTGSKKLTGE